MELQFLEKNFDFYLLLLKKMFLPVLVLVNLVTSHCQGANIAREQTWQVTCQSWPTVALSLVSWIYRQMTEWSPASVRAFRDKQQTGHQSMAGHTTNNGLVANLLSNEALMLTYFSQVLHISFDCGLSEPISISITMKHFFLLSDNDWLAYF